MRSILILFLVLTSCTGAEPRMTAPSNKEKFAIEDFAKSVTAAEFTYKVIVTYGSITQEDGMA